VNRRKLLLTLAAAPVLLREGPEALARRLGGVAVALVTADKESQVVAVELASGAIYARIPTRAGPRSIETVATDALVTHTAHGSVTIIDGERLRVRRVVEGFAEPRYAAAAPDGGHAYVTDSERGEVVVVDMHSGRIVGRTPVGGPARHVTIAPSGRSLWVALGSSAERVVVLDLSEPLRPRVERTIRPPFLAHDVGYEPGGQRVWVTSGDRGAEAVLVYDVRSGRVVRRLAAGRPPQHVTFLAGAAHISSGDDGTLRVRSLQGGRLLRTTPIPLGSYNVQSAWGVVLTPSLTRGTLCVLDRHGRLEREKRVASSSHDACHAFAA
jgi:DNA-binding beta-propeller fold protein YncE